MCEHPIKFEDTKCVSTQLSLRTHNLSLGLLMSSESPWCQPLHSNPLRCLTRTYSLCIVYVLDSVIILVGVCVSHGCCFVCVWLDHYLHQHDRCGPIGATWLGGIATFTTTRDQCIETILYPSVTVAGCVHLVLRFTKYAFLWFILSLWCCLSCLDDVRFYAFPYYDD